MWTGHASEEGHPRMNLALDRIPCFVGHVLAMTRIASSDTAIHEKVRREVLEEMADWDMSPSAPVLSQRVQRWLRASTGVAGPYLGAKQRFNEPALELLPELRAAVEGSADPCGAAVREAVAGNVIGVGVDGNLCEAGILNSLSQSSVPPFAGDLDSFRAPISVAGRILYLTDITGEIVFDRLPIERLTAAQVTVAVRGAPVLNDAALADARLTGLDEIAEVIDNGSDAPGTSLAECGATFLERFENGDMIIAKWQGKVETLFGGPGCMFFLPKVKRPVVAAHTGLDAGTHSLIWQCGRQTQGTGNPS